MKPFDDLARLPAASFRAPPPQAAWTQVNVALVRSNGSALPSARSIFRALVPMLSEWDAGGTLHGWFFMRKPPDVRLRFCFVREAQDAASAIDRTLRDVERLGEIGPSFWSEYAPEEERFGGPRAMALAHAYWNADSTLWCALDDLDERGLRRTPADTLLPAVIHHLFERCCGTGRAIEAWRTLSHTIDGDGDSNGAEDDSDARVWPVTLDALTAGSGLYSREREALGAYAAVNELLCAALAEEAASQGIDRAPSGIAATVAFFNLNRHGFPGERSARMTARVIAALTAEASEREALPDAQGPHFQR